VLPRSAIEIVEVLMQEYSLSIDVMAEDADISTRTIRRILMGKRVSGTTDWKLVRLYLQLRLAPAQ